MKKPTGLGWLSGGLRKKKIGGAVFSEPRGARRVVGRAGLLAELETPFRGFVAAPPGHRVHKTREVVVRGAGHQRDAVGGRFCEKFFHEGPSHRVGAGPAKNGR